MRQGRPQAGFAIRKSSQVSFNKMGFRLDCFYIRGCPWGLVAIQARKRKASHPAACRADLRQQAKAGAPQSRPRGWLGPSSRRLTGHEQHGRPAGWCLRVSAGSSAREAVIRHASWLGERAGVVQEQQGMKIQQRSVRPGLGCWAPGQAVLCCLQGTQIASRAALAHGTDLELTHGVWDHSMRAELAMGHRGPTRRPCVFPATERAQEGLGTAMNMLPWGPEHICSLPRAPSSHALGRCFSQPHPRFSLGPTWPSPDQLRPRLSVHTVYSV